MDWRGRESDSDIVAQTLPKKVSCVIHNNHVKKNTVFSLKYRTL